MTELTRLDESKSDSVTISCKGTEIVIHSDNIHEKISAIIDLLSDGHNEQQTDLNSQSDKSLIQNKETDTDGSEDTQNEPEYGTVTETTSAALSHDDSLFDEYEDLVGIVGKPPTWFSDKVKNHYPELTPPYELYSEFNEQRDKLQNEYGREEVTAHNDAWIEVDYGDKFKKRLQSNQKSMRTLQKLAERVRNGKNIVLVGLVSSKEKKVPRDIVKEEIERLSKEKPPKYLPKHQYTKPERVNDEIWKSINKDIWKALHEYEDMINIPTRDDWTFSNVDISHSTFQKCVMNNWIVSETSFSPKVWKTTADLKQTLMIYKANRDRAEQKSNLALQF